MARIVELVEGHPLMLYQLAGEVFGRGPGEKERARRVNELDRVVSRNPDKLRFVLGPGYIDHVAVCLDQQREQSAVAEPDRAGDDQVDDRPIAVTKVSSSLSEAGPLPAGAERFVLKSMEWCWLSPKDARLIDRYPRQWELDEDDVPAINVTVETMTDVSSLIDGQDLADWLSTLQRSEKKRTRKARTVLRPMQVELF